MVNTIFNQFVIGACMLTTLTILSAQEWEDEAPWMEFPKNNKQAYFRLLSKMARLQSNQQESSYNDPAEDYYTFETGNSLSNRNVPDIDLDRNEPRQSRYLSPMDAVLCETVRTRGEFRNKDFEFRPSHYFNLTCVSTDVDPYTSNDLENMKEFCFVRNSGCATQYKEISVYKRRYRYKCWEHTTQVVAVGCRCHVGFKYY